MCYAEGLLRFPYFLFYYSLAFTKTKTFKSCLEKIGYGKVTGTETQAFYVTIQVFH